MGIVPNAVVRKLLTSGWHGNRLAIGYERAGGVGIDGERVGQVVDRADVWRHGVTCLIPGSCRGHFISAALLEVLQSSNQLQRETVGQRNLLLHVQRKGCQVFPSKVVVLVMAGSG